MLLSILIFLKVLTSPFFWFSVTLKVTFLGDIMQHQAQLDAARGPGADRNKPSSYDYSDYFKHIGPILARSDLRVANMETTFAKPPYSGYPNFNSPISLLEYCKQGGIDLFLSANNHICDKGNGGIEGTISAYNSIRAPYAGVYRDLAERDSIYPLIIELKGVRLAILNYTYGTNGIPVPPPYIVNLLDSAQIRRDILRAGEMEADVIIACLHWGDEYKLTPSDNQRRWKRFFNNNGVNIIVGSHPHVVQPVEIERELSGEVSGITAYSLGNAISNMTAPNTRTGMMLTIRIVRERFGKIRVIEPEYEFISTSRPGQIEKNFTILPGEYRANRR
jgi:poly-gamma-glutamate synthesis protein (capsule biosynthesis protein)